jgi:hypothetical protein
VDVDAIRSRFIQENLRRALEQRDRERAVRTLRAFRNYYQWFESRFPDREKLTIAGQLEQLDDAYAGETSDEGTPQASAR